MARHRQLANASGRIGLGPTIGQKLLDLALAPPRSGSDQFQVIYLVQVRRQKADPA
jgi:hypothetical protein